MHGEFGKNSIIVGTHSILQFYQYHAPVTVLWHCRFSRPVTMLWNCCNTFTVTVQWQCRHTPVTVLWHKAYLLDLKCYNHQIFAHLSLWCYNCRAHSFDSCQSCRMLQFPVLFGSIANVTCYSCNCHTVTFPGVTLREIEVVFQHYDHSSLVVLRRVVHAVEPVYVTAVFRHLARRAISGSTRQTDWDRCWDLERAVEHLPNGVVGQISQIIKHVGTLDKGISFSTYTDSISNFDFLYVSTILAVNWWISSINDQIIPSNSKGTKIRGLRFNLDLAIIFSSFFS